MSYLNEYTNNASTDRQSNSYDNVHMDEAYTQQFVPMSKYLNSITLKMKRYQNIEVYTEARLL